jgi:hypothetical protein
VFSPLHGIPLNSHERPKSENLQLGVLECKVYHDALMNSKSRNDFDFLRNLRTLDMVEEDNDKSWQCSRMLEYNEDRKASGEHQLNCLVGWKTINKTQSWVNFSAMSLNNPTSIIAFAIAISVLNKMPYCHLLQYCKSKTEVEIARIQKMLTIPTSFKYKFVIQVSKRINNAIDLDKKNSNSLWRDAVRSELKQLTDHQTFFVFDSGEDIPKDY